MTDHQLQTSLYRAAHLQAQVSSTDAESIKVTRQLQLTYLISAGAETRTVPNPEKDDIFLTLYGLTVGGTITITVTNGYNPNADTTLSMTTAGQWFTFQSFYTGSAYRWSLVDSYALSNLSPTELGWLDGVTAGTSAASKAMVADSSGNMAFTGALTTTDGVASGTARKVGGLGYAAVADSTAVTSTATETAFDALYAIPANTLKAGTVLKIRWAGQVTAANGTDTGIFKLYLATNTTAGSVAGTAFVTSSTTDMTANDIVMGETLVQIRTAGASGTLVAASNFTKVEAATAVATTVAVVTNSTAVNTQLQQTVAVTCTFNSTNAGNSAKLMVMAVEVIG